MEELIDKYKEYCEFLDDNSYRSDIGATQVKFLKGSFRHFITWIRLGSATYFGHHD